MNLPFTYQYYCAWTRGEVSVPGSVLALNGRLLHNVAESNQRIPRLVARSLGLDDLDELHLRYRATTAPSIAAWTREKGGTYLKAWKPANLS